MKIPMADEHPHKLVGTAVTRYCAALAEWLADPNQRAPQGWLKFNVLLPSHLKETAGDIGTE